MYALLPCWPQVLRVDKTAWAASVSGARSADRVPVPCPTWGYMGVNCTFKSPPRTKCSLYGTLPTHCDISYQNSSLFTMISASLGFHACWYAHITLSLQPSFPSGNRTLSSRPGMTASCLTSATLVMAFRLFLGFGT